MDEAAAGYEQLSFHEAAESIMALCSRGNQLLEEAQPWTALKKVRSSVYGCSSSQNH